MHSPTPESYHVALKAFIRKVGDVLILDDAHGKKCDLPGGRIGIGEFEVPLGEILRREIVEELGPDFKYKNNGPAAFFRHRRPENTLENKPEVRIFMIGFELEYLGGEIALSHEHIGWRWVPLAEAAKMLPAGQQNGMEKYLAYLESGRKTIVYRSDGKSNRFFGCRAPRQLSGRTFQLAFLLYLNRMRLRYSGSRILMRSHKYAWRCKPWFALEPRLAFKLGLV